MKKGLFTLVIALLFVACKTEKEVEAVTTELDATKSYLWWQGAKVIGGGKHSGTMDISKTVFTIEDGQLTSGEIVANLDTMKSEDLEGKMAENLIGHLSSDDFFNVEQFPTATFTIKSVAEGTEGMHNLTGDMTIRDVTKEITVPAKVTITDGKVTGLESEFQVDRSDYGVNFGSSKKFLDLAKDEVIKDMIDLKVFITS